MEKNFKVSGFGLMGIDWIPLRMKLLRYVPQVDPFVHSVVFPSILEKTMCAPEAMDTMTQWNSISLLKNSRIIEDLVLIIGE